MKAKLKILSTYGEAIEEAVNAVSKNARSLNDVAYVFTEEKETLQIEKRLSAVAGGFFGVKIYSFAKYLFNRETVNNLLPKESSVMILRKIIIDNAENLKCFNKTKFKSLAPEMYELIAQLKSANVTPEDLKRGTEGAEGILKEKLSDICLLYGEYEKRTKNVYVDQNEFLSLVPKAIQNDENIKNAEVYLVGYSSWTRQAVDVISALLKNCKSVTALLVGGENDGVYSNETTEQFLSACSRLKIKCEIEKVKPTVLEEAKLITEKVFSVLPENEERYETDKIFIYEAEDYKDEIEHVASIIKRDVIEKNMRYSDFVLGVGDVAQYKKVIKEVFSSYDIPCFLDERESLSTQPIARLAVSYLDVIRKNFDAEEVFKLIKNPLFTGDKSLADEFENYSLKYSVKRKNFLNEERFEGEDLKPIAKLLASAFISAKKRATAAEFSSLIFGLFKLLNAEEKCKLFADKLVKSGEEEEAAYSVQSYDKLTEILGGITAVLGDTFIDADEYKSVLTSGLNAVTISIIPQFNDAVYVGGLKEVRLSRAKYLFSAGLSSDVPGTKSDVALLTDRDLSRLDELKVSVDPKIRVVNRRERENTVLGMVGFKNRLYLSYSAYTGGKAEASRSKIIDYVTEIFCRNGKPLYPLNRAVISASYDKNVTDRIKAMSYLSKAQAKRRFAAEIGDYLSGKGDLSAASAYYFAEKQSGEKDAEQIALLPSEKNVSEIKNSGKEKSYVSATELETFFSCPYMNFAKSFLKLKERETGEIKSNESGNYLHEVFKRYADRIDKVKDKNSSDLLVDEIAKELEEGEKYKILLSVPSEKAAILRLRSEAKASAYKIYEQVSNSPFRIVGKEVEFDDGKGLKYGAIKLDVDGKEMKVAGRIDRLDKAEDYVRVIDYKSGSYDESEEALFSGRKLQLFLYLNVFDREKEKPIGAYYFPVDYNYQKADEKKASLVGATLATPFTDEKGALPEEKFNALIEYAKLVSEEGAREISKGFIAPSPADKACAYCQANGICGFCEGVTGNAREIGKVDTDTVFQAINGKKREGDGDES